MPKKLIEYYRYYPQSRNSKVKVNYLAVITTVHSTIAIFMMSPAVGNNMSFNSNWRVMAMKCFTDMEGLKISTAIDIFIILKKSLVNAEMFTRCMIGNIYIFKIFKIEHYLRSIWLYKTHSFKQDIQYTENDIPLPTRQQHPEVREEGCRIVPAQMKASPWGMKGAQAVWVPFKERTPYSLIEAEAVFIFFSSFTGRAWM